jgi:SAM-dependent methyltransferase
MIQSEPEKNKGFNRRIRRLNQFVPQRGNLLDVGCGFGHFMYLAQKAGWHVNGIEPHKAAVEHCRRHYGFHVELNVMENRQFQSESFKALTLWDVWEHVYNPVAFMDQCIEMLAPGGILAVAIPNASGWPARLFKGHWRYVMITHLSYFKMSYVYNLMDQRHMTCIKADHTFKLHSILEGLLAKLHVSLNMERVIRMGRHGGLEEKIPESAPTSQSKDGQSATSRLTYQLRQTALRLNLWRFSSPIGDMVDLYFRKS